ncbi:MAG: hypothetical protein GY765_00655 [bacterium]|nr:hypothetical protein [bacterium]
MKTTIRVMLLLLLFAGALSAAGKAYATKTVPMPELMNPGNIFVDNTQLYIVERATVIIYKKKDLTLVKKFGKEGEGPAEFKTNSASGIRFTP